MPGPIYLREWRERRWLTMRELAAASGVAVATIVRLEHGGPARISTVRRLAQALGIAPDDLLRAPPAQRRRARKT